MNRVTNEQYIKEISFSILNLGGKGETSAITPMLANKYRILDSFLNFLVFVPPLGREGMTSAFFSQMP